MTNSKISIGEAQNPTKSLATYQVVEDAQIKEVQRLALNDSEGAGYNNSNPLPTKLDGSAGTGISPETGAVGSIGWLSSIYKKLSSTLTATINNLPATIGRKDSANSLSVVLSSDHPAAPFNLREINGASVGLEGIRVRSREGEALADKFFTSSINPTIGTPVALGIAAQNAYAPLAPNILISAGATKKISLERLILAVGVAGTGLTSLRISIRVSKTNKYTSGGTTITALSSLTQTASTGTVRVGTVAIVSPAEGTDTLRVYNGTIKNAIPAVNDTYTLDFGNEYITESNVGGRTAMKCPPIIIPAGGCAMINIWGPGQTAAPTFEGMLYFTEE